MLSIQTILKQSCTRSINCRHALVLSTGLAAGILLFQSPAVAQLTLADEDCIAGEVVAGGIGFTACRGSFLGNDAQRHGEPLLSQLNSGLFADTVGQSTWTYYGKSDAGIFMADKSAQGLWTLRPGEVLNSPFVLSLKASRNFSAYLFTEVNQVTGGEFTTAGVATNKRGIPQDLSHASIYVTDDDRPVHPVPFEPVSTLGLLAFTGMAAKAYRQRAREF